MTRQKFLTFCGVCAAGFSFFHASIGQQQTPTASASAPVPYSPSRQVSAEEYFDLLGTTGSYRVNKQRADADHQAALAKARQMKKLKMDMGRVQYYPPTHSTANDVLTAMVPAPAPTNEELETQAVTRAPQDVYVPRFTVNQPPPLPGVQSQSYGENPRRGKLFSKLFGGKPNRRFDGNPYNDENAEPSFSPPPPTVPTAPTTPAAEASFAPLAENSTAFNSPESVESAPKKRKLFSKIFGSQNQNQNQNLNPVAQAEALPPTAPPANYPESEAPAPPAPSPPPPPAPTMSQSTDTSSVFRSGSTARGKKFSVVRGSNVFAEVGDKKVKISDGTRVKVLTAGTDRSVVELYDSRRALLPNSVLVPEGR